MTENNNQNEQMNQCNMNEVYTDGNDFQQQSNNFGQEQTSDHLCQNQNFQSREQFVKNEPIQRQNKLSSFFTSYAGLTTAVGVALLVGIMIGTPDTLVNQGFASGMDQFTRMGSGFNTGGCPFH